MHHFQQRIVKYSEKNERKKRHTEYSGRVWVGGEHCAESRAALPFPFAFLQITDTKGK